MSLLPLKGQPVSLTLILFELAQPERKRYTKAHSCRCERVKPIHIHARIGILTRDLSILSAMDMLPIPSFY